jgi:hypothetical protein
LFYIFYSNKQDRDSIAIDIISKKLTYEKASEKSGYPIQTLRNFVYNKRKNGLNFEKRGNCGSLDAISYLNILNKYKYTNKEYY